MKKYILPLILILFLLLSMSALGAVAFVAISEFKTNGGTTIVMSAHADTSEGDLLIAYISKDDNVDIDETGGYGDFTMLYNDIASGANCLYIGWRIADAGDAGGSPTEYTFTSDSEDWIGEMITYSGVHASPIHDSGVDTGDSGTPTAPSVAFTDLTVGSLVFQCMGIDSDDNDYVTPAQLTERFNAIQANDIGGAGGDKIAPGGWVLPTGNNDPGTEWDDESNAYDTNLLTRATRENIPSDSWSNYIEFTIDAISCSKVKFYATYGVIDVNEISVDVYYSSAWHNIYEGAFASLEWVEKAIGSTQTVTAMKYKFYNDSVSARIAYLWETAFWEIPTAGSGNTGTAVFTATSRAWAAATVIIEAEAEEPPEGLTWNTATITKWNTKTVTAINTQ
jgi:hypothetical protein